MEADDRDRDDWPPPGQFDRETSKPDHQRLLRAALWPPCPALDQPSLTNCFFHSSADIGSSLMAYRARTWTWSVNMPRCLPIETSAACLSCIFTRKPFEVCETSATARAGLGRQRRAVDDQDAALKHLACRLVGVVRVLELLVDELWSPAHDLADVGEAEHRQFAQDLLNRDFGPLGAGSEDFFDASANANIC